MINKFKTNTNIINSFFRVTKSIYISEGVSGFWRGLTPDLIRYSFGSAIYFGVLVEIE